MTTSGTFTAYPIDKIVVDREGRQRREIKDVTSLAESIRAVGLINPITITRDGVLIAGERRLTAVKSLGWTSVSVQFVDELEPDVLHLIELEENVRRLDISWQERCVAVSRYHDLRKARDEAWNLDKSSEELGMSKRSIMEYISIAGELKKDNDKVKTASSYSTALGIIERAKARKTSSAIAAIAVAAPAAAGLPVEVPAEKIPPLLNTDFAEWAEAYDGPQFNLLHCDFPYGVGMHNSDQGAGEGFGTYTDTFAIYDSLLDVLASQMEKLVAPSAHLLFWFSMDYYAITKTRLEMMGWAVNPFPLIWYKSDNIGILPDPTRGPRRIYETCFFASRGDRPIVRAVSNVFAAPGRGKSIHMNEKPVEMLSHFLRMVCDEYSRVLDPTCGSANAIRAAESLGATTVLGLEINPEFFNLAKEAYYGI